MRGRNCCDEKRTCAWDRESRRRRDATPSTRHVKGRTPQANPVLVGVGNDDNLTVQRLTALKQAFDAVLEAPQARGVLIRRGMHALGRCRDPRRRTERIVIIEDHEPAYVFLSHVFLRRAPGIRSEKKCGDLDAAPHLRQSRPSSRSTVGCSMLPMGTI